MNIFTLSKFLLLPEIRRNSFNDFCKEYTVSETQESNKHTLCVIALDSGDKKQFSEVMDTFKEE